MGPLELRPIAGRTWAAAAHPDRLPATYTRPHGTRQWLAFLDTKKDHLWGLFKPSQTVEDVLRAFQWMRSRYPVKERIYLILDNFSPHKRLEVRRWARETNVSLLWTPTNASWLNHIECQFTELKRFVFTNSNYKSHQQVNIAIYDFLRYRNRRNAKHKKTYLKRHWDMRFKTQYWSAKRGSIWRITLVVVFIIIALLAISDSKPKRVFPTCLVSNTKSELDVGCYFSLYGVKELRNSCNIDSASDMLVFVFSIFCPGCEANIVHWNYIFAMSERKKASVVGISLDPKGPTTAYIEGQKIQFPVFFCSDQFNFQHANHVNILPLTVLRSHTGVVQGVWRGVLSDRDVLRIQLAVLG